MRKSILFIIAMILVNSSLVANDCVFYVNGNQLVPSDQESDISVKKEILTISLQDNGFTKVDVYYEFNNNSQKPKTVLMGFEADNPYNAEEPFNPKGVHPNIYNFTVNMNGSVLPYSNAIVESEIPEGFKPLDLNTWKAEGQAYEDSGYQVLQNGDKTKKFSYAYSFKATFEPGINRIVHSYNYDTSFGVGQAFMIDYKLTPATRWANKQIDDFTLVIRADNTAKHFRINKAAFKTGEFKLIEGVGKCRDTKYADQDWVEISLRNGVYSWHSDNYKPADELAIYSCESLYYDYDNDKEPLKLGSTYDRSRTFTYMHPIDTDFKVRVAHNLPYAHRGYVFSKPELKEYFEKFWWYMPDPQYKPNTDDFTEKDWEFVKKEKDKE